MDDLIGRARGGVARANALSPEQRVTIARQAALSRWNSDVSKATHTGDLKLGTLDIACAVLPDGTRVLSQRGVGRALGRSFGGSDWKKQEPSTSNGGETLPFFLSANTLTPFISENLLSFITKPILYRHSKGGGVAFGVVATALPEICDVWLKAREAGALNKTQQAVAQKAETLMRGLAQVGIVALVDEATGYQEVRDKLALQQILDRYLTAEKAKWAKTFPDDYYKKLFRVRGKPYNPGSVARPGFIAHDTNNIVYERLAPGVLDKLQEYNPTQENGRRRGKHHQFFTAEYGIPELKHHIEKVMFLMDAAGENNFKQFILMLNRAAPRKGSNLELDI